MRYPKYLPKFGFKSTCVLAGIAAITTGLALTPHSKKPASSSNATSSPALTSESGPATSLGIVAALQAGGLSAEFKSNGRDKTEAKLTNNSKRSLSLKFHAGQLFENGKNNVIITRASEVQLKAGEAKTVALATAATSTQNKIADASYTLATGAFPKLEPLLSYLVEHPEISSAAAQTSVLVLTENMPLRAYAKFTVTGGDVPSQLDTSAFKVETVDIVSALSALREVGIPDDHLAITIDPQLKVEAMIDPLAHALAMRYYGISQDEEWNYWKNELTSGNPSTRHYALYGIARFFPDVAIEMMPKWVRETRTHPAFRVSAVQALAETQRPEALAILKKFVTELDPASEVGQAAYVAANYLEARLGKNAASKVAVAFRVSQSVNGL